MGNKQDRRGVLVVGSANMDMVVSCARFPMPGETVLAEDFGMYPGGKGANQAVAGAKLGGDVVLLAKMGRDGFREKLMDSLERDGVHLDHVLVDEDAPTGIALITVDGTGENEIVVVSGSNMALSPDDVAARDELFAGAAVALFQLEIPVDTIRKAMALAKAHGATVVLNPAPARALPDDLLAQVDVLTPNESEAALLSGMAVRDEASAEEAARRLLGCGVGCVVVTLGARGALLVGPDHTRHFPAVAVEAVDTTAAGDAFNGALAVALAQGRSPDEAIPFANTVAAFAVTRRGAQPSMPTREELRTFAGHLSDGRGTDPAADARPHSGRS